MIISFMEETMIIMGKYNKAANSSMLYEKRQAMEKELYDHKLFKLSNEQAAEIIFKKIGSVHRLIMLDENKFKKILGLDFPSFELIDFFQCALFEIFKGINLINNEIIDENVSITVDEFLPLMASAYKLSLYKKYESFHAKDIVKLSIKKNSDLNFNYVNGDSVKYNITYDVFFKNLETKSIIADVSRSEFIDYHEAMDITHEKMFQTNADIQFDGFNLEDYKAFTTFLNRIAVDELMNNVIIVNQSGFINKSLVEWTNLITENTILKKQVVSNILEFLTFDFSNSRSDISLSYFVPINNQLFFLPSFFMLQRLDSNIFRLLNVKNSKKFSSEQKKFEKQQIEYLKNNLPKNVLIAEGKKALPGVDLLVYNPFQEDLQVIELKFKIPIDSPQEIIKLDKSNISKALEQNIKAREFISASILEEYFGERFSCKKPKKINYFTLTNYSIGLGTTVKLPSPILLVDHYLKCMNTVMGNSMVNYALENIDKGLPRKIKNKYSKISLFEETFIFPVYFAEFININEFINDFLI